MRSPDESSGTEVIATLCRIDETGEVAWCQDLNCGLLHHVHHAHAHIDETGKGAWCPDLKLATPCSPCTVHTQSAVFSSVNTDVAYLLPCLCA